MVDFAKNNRQIAQILLLLIAMNSPLNFDWKMLLRATLKALALVLNVVVYLIAHFKDFMCRLEQAWRSSFASPPLLTRRVAARRTILPLLLIFITFVCEKVEANCLPGSVFCGSPGTSNVFFEGNCCGWNCCWCNPGYYTDGNYNCAACPPGTFASGREIVSLSQCISCAAGSYSDVVSMACTLCPTGTYTVNSQTGSTSVSACTICAPGFYGSVTNGGTLAAAGCRPCPAGFYSAAGADTCTACPSSISTLSPMSTSVAACTVCAPGYFGISISNGGTTSASGCMPCPPGLSTNNLAGSTSQAACTSCAAGYIGTASGGCTVCPAGSWGQNGMMACVLCSPGTYSLAGATACSPCPEGTYGSSAGLASSICTGICASMMACPLGTAYPPPAAPITSLSCASSGARAVPTALGVLLWPAAHPSNPQHVDLIIAPLAVCQQLTSSMACAAAASIMGMDGVMRFVVGTAAALNLEAAEALTCNAQ